MIPVPIFDALEMLQVFDSIHGRDQSDIDPAHVISFQCVEVSLKCNVALIIVLTTSGLSAKIIAKYRPRCPILAIIKQRNSAKKMSVWRNLVPVHYLGK